MKQVYSGSGRLIRYFLVTVLISVAVASSVHAQSPTVVGPGICTGIIANFNTNDNGFNSPSIYGGIFDSAFYYHAGRGYWTDYLPPHRTSAPAPNRVLNIISPPYPNPNPNGTFNVGFYYIITNRNTDQFQVRIISVTQTPSGTVTNVEASSGVQDFEDWSTPTPYDDMAAPVPDPTPHMGAWQGYVCIRLVDPDIVNAPNTTFRVEVSYIAKQGRFVVFDNVSIGPELIPTPVYFIGMLADRNTDNSVALRWDVSEEINVSEYQVERSSGNGFAMVGTVVAKGKSIYNFTDNSAPSGTLYYRIRSVDVDGSARYSGILRLKGNTSYGTALKLYPSPARDNLTVEHARVSRSARITVTSVDGKVLRTLVPAPAASHTMISLSGLSPGVYFVRMDDGKGNVQSMKFIKE
ncbi:MAG TPA: T9SS type A sorting domain-containing protein [Chitinophagaceae bacterium]|nr:T9SS type A sorting domain-containing protein [Chitinophagaceae bacterium]